MIIAGIDPGKTGAITLTPFPDSFPHKGEFVVWDSAWNRIGYSPERQHPGQMPITYPEDATLIEIQFGGYLRWSLPA